MFDVAVVENFYTSGAAKLCPPDRSAHISSHNAVKSAHETDIRYRQVRLAQDQMRGYKLQQLEENYQKACKRASRKGRSLPPKEQYYDHWGYSYYSMSSFNLD